MSDNKYKINVDRPQISKEEIEGYKDFNSVLGATQNIRKPLIQRPQIWAWSGLAAACMVALIYFVGFYSNKNVVVASYTYINPPIKNVQIKYVDYEVPADSGMTIHCASGTEIVIPKAAFADKNGNIIRGKVKLKYREFHDMAECFISGIPMSYDSAGKQYDFQTAGMFDIDAFSGDRPAYIANGKKIRVEMASADKEHKFNFYKLDTVSKKWVFMGKDTANRMTTETTKISDPPKAQQNNKPQITSNKYASTNPPAFMHSHSIKATNQDNIAYLDGSSWENFKKHNYHDSMITLEDGSGTFISVPNHLVIHSPKPIIPKKADPDGQTFMLDILPEQFPELASYKDVVFEVGKENKNFDKNSFKINWQDIKLAKWTKPGSYNLTLSTPSKKYSVIVYPVFKGSDYDSAMKIYNKKFKDYETGLKAKEAEQVAEKNWHDETHNAQVARTIHEQSDTNSEVPKVSDVGVKRVFEINSFGIYNWDHPCGFQNPVFVKIRLGDNEGNPLILNTIYLVDRTKMFVHLYSGNDAEAEIRFEPADNNILFGLLPGNKIAIFKNEKFAMLSSKNHGATTIAMDIPDAKVNDLHDLRDLVFGKAKKN